MIGNTLAATVAMACALLGSIAGFAIGWARYGRPAINELAADVDQADQADQGRHAAPRPPYAGRHAAPPPRWAGEAGQLAGLSRADLLNILAEALAPGDYNQGAITGQVVLAAPRDRQVPPSQQTRFAAWLSAASLPPDWQDNWRNGWIITDAGLLIPPPGGSPVTCTNGK